MHQCFDDRSGTQACTATLSSAAPNGGQVVNLSSNNAAVIVPYSVTVPAKTTAAQFTATVQPVTSPQTVGLTASVGKNSQTFSIKLNPVQPALSVSSSSVNFGTVAVGSVVTQPVTLTSTGNAAVTVSSGSVAGAGLLLDRRELSHDPESRAERLSCIAIQPCCRRHVIRPNGSFQ